MKKQVLTITLLILLATLNLSANSLIQTSQDLLEIDNQTIRYSDYDNILLPNGLSVPFQTIYIPMTEINSVSTFSAKSASKENIATFSDLQAEEIPTASDKNQYSDIVSSVAFDQLGTKQLQPIQKVTISGIDYMKSMFFPVTLDNAGNAYFHKETEIHINNEIISATQLLTKNDLNNSEKNNRIAPNFSSSSETRYIIITNSELKDSFSQLMTYKNQTGIKTEIKLIEDILAAYNGRDDAERLREYLKDFYNNGGQYVLLGGDETVLPIRYAYHNIAYTEIGLESQQVTDLYFADLTGDWNFDNDAVWGEKYTDSVDLTPELYVGRLPFNKTYEVTQYIEKLIQYETNEKQIDLSYLEKSFFFCSDQMRDYGTGGQHKLIAEALPDYFTVDTTNGVEFSSGNDLTPTNPSSKELEPILAEGFGIVNIIAHGSSMTFGVRTSNYNDWPKSYFTTDTNLVGSGIVNNIETNGKVSLYLSLGCDNGAFDKDQPPFNHLSPNMVQTLLAQDNSGAVAFVANTRWGWVGSSHLLQTRFLEYLFENQELPAIMSLYQMKNDYYYYRDLIYGINFFGDPTLVIHTKKPAPMRVEVEFVQNEILLTALSNNSGIENSTVYLSQEDEIIGTYTTDFNGQVNIEHEFDMGSSYNISTVKDGFITNQTSYIPSIATDINDELNQTLPTSFALRQNYPNPFNPSTQISLSLPKKTELTLKVFNMLGQEVKTIAQGSYSAGIHSFEWDGTDNSGTTTATGIYLYRFESEYYNDVKKMVLLR